MTFINWYTIGGVLLMVVGFLVGVWSVSDYFRGQYGILGWVLMTFGGGFLTLGVLKDRNKRKGV
jgi:hypothetical protein